VSDPLTLLAELVSEMTSLRARLEELEQHRDAGKRWLTIDETAAYLGITAKAIRRRVDRGRLPIVRDGRRLYVDRTALDDAFAEKRSTLPATSSKALATRERPRARPQEV
jgi:excisionase family DNA binding protein